VVAINAEGTTNGPDKTFSTFATKELEQADSCPNAVFRNGLSANLPDCRAYEMVSPVDKNGADVNGQGYKEFTSAESGERVQFPARTGMAETQGSGEGGYTQFVAVRGVERWETKGIIPTPALSAPLMLFFGATEALAFSDELDRAVLIGYSLPGVAGAVPERENLYLENALTGGLIEPITRFEGPGEPVNGFSVATKTGGDSGDLSVVTFTANANLALPATGTASKVYALDHGVVRLVGILPDGTVPTGGSILARPQNEGVRLTTITYKDTVSRDGSRILFLSPARGNKRQLYMRKNETETVQVSESEATEPAEALNVRFQGATPDGTKVLFTTTSRLLDGDPGGEGIALYLYKDGPDPKAESNLTFIARFGGETGGGREGQYVKGISDDGSHIYFVPVEDMFLWDNGRVTQVVPAPGATGSIESGEEARVSADGKRIAFMNSRPLTANASEISTAVNGVKNTELYVYDENRNKLICVSCPPSGAMATSGIEMTVQATSQSNPGFSVAAQPRFFSQNGKYAFFNTTESLLLQDTNGLTDAYEYNVETGELSLLSSGTGDTGTWFVDASADGRDAFLVTRQKLNGWDPDKLVDLYDARVEGGFPEPPREAVPCAGDECQGTPSATPTFNTSSGFNGLGNLAAQPAPRVKVKALTRAQRLKTALSSCRKKRKKARVACERTARKLYAAKKSANRASRRAGR
jgi:Tol biopolymer transport system component